MSFSKTLFILLLVLISEQLFAQDKVLLVPYHAKKGWGYSDTLAHVVIQPTAFDSVDFFDFRGFARVYKKKKLNMIDSAGNLLLKEYYDKINTWKENDFELWNKNKVGIYNFKKRRYILPVIYDQATNWNNNAWHVRLKKKSAFFSNEGKQLTGFKYDSVATVESDFAVAYSEGKAYKIQFDTGVASLLDTPPEYYGEGVMFDDVMEDPEKIPSLAPIEFAERIKNNMDLDSLERKPVQVAMSEDEIYRLHKKGKVGFYFWTNRDFVQPRYDGLYELTYISKTNYYMIAELDGKQGLINQKEAVIVPFQYDSIYSLDISMAYTIKQGKRGVWMFNTTYPPIQNKYDEIAVATRLRVSDRWQFLIFKVRKNGRTGYVGENGKEYFEQ